MSLRAANILVLFFLCIGLSSVAWANPPSSPPEDEAGWGDDDDDDDAFDESSLPDLKPDTTVHNSPWSMTGTLRSRWGMWLERLDEDPFAKGRQSLDLRLEMARDMWLFRAEVHGEYDLAYLVNRSDYDPATLETYEWLVRSGEIFGRARPGNVEVTVGRQVIAWGEGDALSPLDWINPRDSREFGLADLDDLRLPILATRLAVFFGGHRLELVGVHETDFGLIASPRGPFSPFNTVLASFESTALGPLLSEKTFALEHRQGRFSLDQQEVFFRWVYRGPGIDLGLQVGSFLDRQGVFEFPGMDVLALQDSVELRVDHRRYTAFGHSGAWALDSFLLKWELGADLNRSVNTGSLAVDLPAGADAGTLLEAMTDAGALLEAIPSPSTGESTLLHSMIGLTWSGVQDLRLSVEFGKSWVLDGATDLALPMEDPILLLRGSYDMMRERLQLSAAASLIGWTVDGGWLFRADVSYEVLDGFKVGLGGVTYQPSDEFGPLYGLDTHDRVFAWLRWDFRVM